MKTIRLNEVCKSCGGTGLYVGMGEHDGAAVVCNKCYGSGFHEFIYEYEEYIEKKSPDPVIERVFKCNPGICIGGDLEEFGGMSVKDWQAGQPFPPGSEDRKHTCPCWWQQNSEGKPLNWKACRQNLGRRFSECKHFKTKEMCWDRFDGENQ